jgi:hypothetical protein
MEFFDIWVPLPRSGASGSGLSSIKRKRVRPPERKPLDNLVLDDIPNHRLNLKAVERLYVNDGGVDSTYLDVLMGRNKVADLLLSRPANIRKMSRRMWRSTKYLLEQEILEERHDILCALAIFQVLKKNGRGRLVVNAKPVNKYFKPPPKMQIPPIHDIISYIMSNEVAATADARAFFYQIPLAEQLRPYFGVRSSKGGRGAVFQSAFTVLPMGWSWAPALAQHVANIVVGSSGMAWVDNFVIAGTREDFSAKRAAFLDRCHQCDLLLDDETLEPSESLVALGLEFDLGLKRYRLASAETKEVDSTATRRDVFEVCGKVVWSEFVRRHPLCSLGEVLAVMSRVSRLAHAGNADDWDLPADLSPSEIELLNAASCRYRENPWESWSPDAQYSHTMLAYSDSSDHTAAWIVFDEQDQLVARGQEKVDPFTHIYYKEMHAATAAIRAAHAVAPSVYPGSGPCQVHLRVDNMAAKLSLLRGVSSAPDANKMLVTLAGKPYMVEWVGSDDNLADHYTRGCPLPELGSPLDLIRTEHAAWKKKKTIAL